jgi:maltose O-acetyltransferase
MEPAARRLPGAGIRRIARAVGQEFHEHQPRLWTALVVGRALPPYVGVRIRTRLLRFAGVKVGRRTVIGGRLWVAGSATAAEHLTIGDDCFINDGVRFDTAAPITIGDQVAIGHEVLVLTASHGVGPSERRAALVTTAPVTIEDGAWLGSRSIVMPGVTIGRGAVVGAGAVVTTSVPPDTLVTGVPARPVKSLE